MTDRIQLTDDERERIRWSSTKRGHLIVTRYAPLGRSRRPIRPDRTTAHPVAGIAERDVAARLAVVRNPVTGGERVTVDHLGRVLSREPLTASELHELAR